MHGSTVKKNMLNTYRFSTATMVTGTRLKLTLYVQCLSCCQFTFEMNFTVYKNLLNISSLTHSDSLSKKNDSLHFCVSFRFSNIGTTFPSSLRWGLLTFSVPLLVFLLFYNLNMKNSTPYFIPVTLLR